MTKTDPAAPSSDPLDQPEFAALAQEMAQYGHDRDAPSRSVMAMLGDRWTTLILLILSVAPTRHADLKRIITALSHEGSISQRVLTLKLRALARDGFVLRTASADVPPRVRYELTALGRDLSARASAMIAWINQNANRIHEARRRDDEEGGAEP
ncbi:helix-turn-helix transcriptional regulator [Novosphingobium sp. 1949]|uniref:Helix-turn-helix transcriptional regulator n=1 Tax=Novosphingobium organovorum TaxID=2930092 RepID=A0ABT0BFP5_9SPHN|nr:helix-turn-helix domain-containing protein [Novosphingobium organovorum]MCJ2183599.1 helix-turn-helix transcriptional regulator [Novosphingobium organovorum]